MTTSVVQERRGEAMVEAKPVAVAADRSTDLRVKWNRFYWGVFRMPPGSALMRRIGEPQRWVLEEQFQAELPVPIETLACVFVPVRGMGILACGMAHSEIEGLIVERAELRGAPLLSLGPDDSPPALREELGDARACSVNLLVGRYEPQEIRRLRSSMRWIPMAAAVVAIGLVAMGMRIQTDRASERTRLVREWTREQIAGIGPELAGEADTERALARLLGRLQRTHGERAVNALPPDAGEAIGAVLRAWPRGVETRTTRLSVGERTVSLTVDVPDEKSAETLDGALASIEGWELLPPQAQRTPSGVQVSAMLKPVGPRGGGAP